MGVGTCNNAPCFITHEYTENNLNFAKSVEPTNSAIQKKLNKVKHSFSHYNLEAIPYLAELETKKSYKNTVWVNPKNVKSLALPGPVKELFITLQNYENC